ncbi:MAG: sigma-70 family RNA polymerase sigma factor [Oligoflexales bacterium]|nr:sigma-70 family RNA polymerase sigma factor [Oligoflexales bacterium]
MVYRRCFALLQNEERAKEAMQDVFLRMVSRLSAIDLNDAPSSLLYITATRICLNILRSSRRSPECSCDEILMSIVDEGVSEEKTIARLFSEKILGREIETTQVMAVMHFVDGMTYEEIAGEFKLSVSGIRKRLRVFKERVQMGEANI